MKKIISLVLVFCLLFSLCITASAASTQKASITYRGITLVLDGETFIPCDENGKTVEPFIMEGTTYLPLRALAQALGLGVAWDGKTSTVTLTSGGNVKTGSGSYTPASGTKEVEITYRGIKVVLDGKQLDLKNANGEAVEPFIMDGTTYLPLRTVGEALGLQVGWDGPSSTVTLAQPEAVDGYWALSKTTYTDGYYSYTETYDYDDRGNQIEFAFIDNEGNGYRTTDIYDEEGNYVGWETYDNNGSYFKVTDTPTLYSVEDYSPGTTDYIMITEYDEKGNMTHDLSWDRLTGDKNEAFYYYRADGKLESSYFVYTFDGYTDAYTEVYYWSGNVRTGYTTYDSDPSYTSVSTTTFTYDAQGRVIKEVYLDEFGYGYTVESAYDSYGNEVYHKYDGGDYWWESRQEYDANGNFIFESYADPDMSYTIKNEYNSMGLLVHSEENIPNEGYWDKQDWEYDAEGNVLVERYEDNANYTETRFTYANGLLVSYEVESAGEVYRYKVTSNAEGLPIKAEGLDNGEIFTYEYTYIAAK